MAEVATLRGYVLAVESVAFSKDGKRLATSGANGALKLWDTESWQEVLSLEGPGSGVLTAFGPTTMRLERSTILTQVAKS